MIRLGLCCKFLRAPIRFRTTTVTSLLKMERADALRKLGTLCAANAVALREAIAYCAAHGIGSFRINSQILPAKTHPEAGYTFEELPDADAVLSAFAAAGELAHEHGLRLTFHPDQFVLLSSPSDDVTRRSVAELAYQAEVAARLGADVINIHGGGAYGDPGAALQRLRARIEALPEQVRSRLTLENDDRVYTPADLLPVCRDLAIPFVYDVHHHRCLPDGLSVETVTARALKTWSREPLFHISSPKEGWDGPKPNRHQDHIDLADLPECWLDLDITLEVEAKAKEDAIERLRRHLDPHKVWQGHSHAGRK